MKPSDRQLLDLFDKYRKRQCSKDDLLKMMQLLQNENAEELIDEQLKSLWYEEEGRHIQYPVDWEMLYQNVTEQVSQEKLAKRGIGRVRWLLAAAAASVIAVIVTVSIIWLHPDQQTIAGHVRDKAPGGKKAILQLDGGKVVVLDSLPIGEVARQGNTQLIKSDKGVISYLAENTNSPSLFNTISIPRGGEYQLVLPDGSRVWLNASSSLRYPVAFTGKERRVQLTGEAYFEVSKNPQKPFIVEAAGMSVRVLGTHFNIMSYDDEPGIRTTLLEGKVEVSAADKKAILSPGEQALFDRNNHLEQGPANIDLDLAWKNGYFRVDRADVPTVMRQLARWYDVKVKYEGPVPAIRFRGAIPRNTSLLTVLKILKISGLSYQIEGNTILVQNKTNS
ncbi:MAG TPA: FecR domain-containing protein [Chitinophagaceae bacterium]|nr:FecR domain-containing protein [Chitinophagaceae bacterium]